MKAMLLISTVLIAMVMLSSPRLALGQDNAWEGTTGNWSTGGDWEFGVPTPILDGRANISNGGIVTVDSNISSAPTVVLGEGAASSGTLNIGTGGTLNVVTGAGDPNAEPGAGQGKVLIGREGGTGVLNVTSGGMVTVADEIATPTDGNAASTLSLSGTASVSADSAFLDRRLSISGSSVDFSITNDAILGLGGTHAWEIPAAGSASKMFVGANVDLGGTLKLNFTGGTPSVGSTWDLIDSTTVDAGEDDPSGFSFIDQSDVSGLLPGQAFAVSTVGGGANGSLTQLSLEQHPVLLVNRQTGATELKNFGSAASVSFDHYTIRSPLGFLNDGDWTSLESQAIGTWDAANPGPTALSELEQLSSSSLAGSTSFNLGNAFDLGMPMALGDVTEDLSFEFTKVGDNTPTQGQVVYTGTPIGNVVLTVDSSTGEAQFRNNSPFTIEIDSYAILSESASLDPNSGWSSLDDQDADAGDWIEANVSTSQLSEVQQLNTTILEPGTAFSLGSPFNTSGKRDLTFQYALAGENDFRDGIVHYDAMPSLYSADFDGDGDVDSADRAAWEAAYGVNAAADANFDGKSNGLDFLIWQQQYGSMTPTIVSAVSAVPEPTTVLLFWSWLPWACSRFRMRKVLACF